MDQIAYSRQHLWLQGWVDEDEEGLPSYQDIVGAHDDEDEEFDEKADQFESAYNFRFEVCVAVLHKQACTEDMTLTCMRQDGHVTTTPAFVS